MNSIKNSSISKYEFLEQCMIIENIKIANKKTKFL